MQEIYTKLSDVRGLRITCNGCKARVEIPLDAAAAHLHSGRCCACDAEFIPATVPHNWLETWAAGIGGVSQLSTLGIEFVTEKPAEKK
jgi:hypothetical protein